MKTLAFIVLALVSFAIPASAQEKAYRQELISMKTEDGHALPAVMTMPAEGMNTNAPVMIHIHGGPGATPLAGSGPWIAQGLAARGYTTIAPLVRHGSELYTHQFEEINLDIKATVDFLSALGFRDIILAGSSYGSICSTRYIVDTQDPRIKANLHFAPTADMNKFVQKHMGDKAYWEFVAKAGALVSAGKGDETIVQGQNFTHTAATWLKHWGPASDGVNTMLFPQIKQPVLLLLGDQDGFNNEQELQFLKSRATASKKVDALFYAGGVNHSFYPIQDKVVADVATWLKDVGLAPKARVKTEMLTINEDRMGRGMRRGLQYSPEAGVSTDATGFVILHDWSGEPFSGVPQWLGEALAQNGNVALGIETARAHTVAGQNFGRLNDEIKAWVDHLEKQGLKKIVLIGHGYGGVRANQYAIDSKDSRVTGIVYVSPAADSASWMSAAMGKAAYDAAVAKADADKDTKGADLIQYSIDLPAPAREKSLYVAMTPKAYLDTWGPKAPAFSKQIGAVQQRKLVVSGPHDIYLSDVQVKQLGRGAKGLETVSYTNDDAARQITDAVVAWAAK